MSSIRGQRLSESAEFRAFRAHLDHSMRRPRPSFDGFGSSQRRPSSGSGHAPDERIRGFVPPRPVRRTTVAAMATDDGHRMAAQEPDDGQGNDDVAGTAHPRDTPVLQCVRPRRRCGLRHVRRSGARSGQKRAPASSSLSIASVRPVRAIQSASFTSPSGASDREAGSGFKIAVDGFQPDHPAMQLASRILDR